MNKVYELYFVALIACTLSYQKYYTQSGGSKLLKAQQTRRMVS